MAFTPFMQGTSAQSIINNYLDSGGFNQTIANDSIRNPIFDLRTEQNLPADALYPNPLIDFSVTEDEVVDPCPEGYQLIDGVCQPMEQFGQSLYQPDNQGGNDYSDTRTESQKMYDEMKKDPSIPKRTIPFVKFPGQNCHILFQIKNSKFFAPFKINLDIKLGDLRKD